MDNLKCMKCGIIYQAPNNFGNCLSCGTPTLRIPVIVPYRKFCPACNKDYPLEANGCDCGRSLFILGRVIGWKDEIEKEALVVSQSQIKSKELVMV
jgi:hypothetical protein